MNVSLRYGQGHLKIKVVLRSRLFLNRIVCFGFLSHSRSDITVSSVTESCAKGGEFEPTASRLTQPSIPPWVCKMCTWQMIVMGRICAFQIGSLRQMGKQDATALVLRGAGSS